MAVADRIGMDGTGEGGVVGYTCYLARTVPRPPTVNFYPELSTSKKSIPSAQTVAADQLDADVRQPIRTDRQQSEDVLIEELTIMAIKEPEAFCAALAALLPRPSKRRRHVEGILIALHALVGIFWRLAHYFSTVGTSLAQYASGSVD